MIASIKDYKKAKSEEEIKVAVEKADFSDLADVVSEIREDKGLDRNFLIFLVLYGLL